MGELQQIEEWIKKGIPGDRRVSFSVRTSGKWVCRITQYDAKRGCNVIDFFENISLKDAISEALSSLDK